MPARFCHGHFCSMNIRKHQGRKGLLQGIDCTFPLCPERFYWYMLHANLFSGLLLKNLYNFMRRQGIRATKVYSAVVGSIIIQFAYHNHTTEFDEVEGQRPFDYILSNTDKDLVKMELDLAWATKANQDPVDLFKQHPDAFPCGMQRI